MSTSSNYLQGLVVATALTVSTLLFIRISRQKGDTLPGHKFIPTSFAAELDTATKLALQAGENMIKPRKQLQITEKSEVDFVTAIDVENEQLIFQGLQKRFPTYKFIGEEQCSSEGTSGQLDDSPTWVVDPIDGTTNFMHALPFSCVSIALVIDRRPVVGVVFNPGTGEMFQAVRGQGAYLNGQRIHVSGVTDLTKALVLTELGYDRSEAKIKIWLESIHAMIRRPARSVRLLGSAALDMCYLACGRLDGVFSSANGDCWKMWDYAAGMLLVTEAGGVVHTLRNKPFRMNDGPLIAAASEVLCTEMCEVLSPLLTEEIP